MLLPFFASRFKLFLDFLLPPSADEKRVRALTIPHLYTLLAPQQHGHIETLFRYREPDIRILLWQTKYKDDAHAAQLLGTMLREVLCVPLRTPHILIPIPLAPARFRERGFNQVERIAQFALTDISHIALCADVLIRTHHRTAQTRLSHKERRKNLDHVFKVINSTKITGAHIMLLDDITTTGTTLRRARHELLKAGAATVHCVALAH